MIDENKPKIPCWLIWSTTNTGLVTLESICLANWIAKSHKQMLQDERVKNFISVKIEKAEANHLFAADLDQKWWAEYGEASAKRNEMEVVNIEKNRREIAEKHIKEFREAVSEYMTTGEDKRLRSVMTVTMEYQR